MSTVAAVAGTVKPGQNGTFTAIASTGSLDRDGEILLPGCFDPLPTSVPVHFGHPRADLPAEPIVVARGRPYYSGDRLMLDAYFASTAQAQHARQLVNEGVLDAVSVMFIVKKKETRKGVPTVVSAELVAIDLVTIPSNRDALVVSSRAFPGGRMGYNTRAAILRARAAALTASAKATLAATPAGPRTPEDPYIRGGFTPATTRSNRAH